MPLYELLAYLASIGDAITCTMDGAYYTRQGRKYVPSREGLEPVANGWRWKIRYVRV